MANKQKNLWVQGISEMLPPKNPKVCKFDLEVKRLRLKEHQYKGSDELRIWCSHNNYKRYIPEDLLAHWNLLPKPELEPETYHISIRDALRLC
jgi:hypothetical protein